MSSFLRQRHIYIYIRHRCDSRQTYLRTARVSEQSRRTANWDSIRFGRVRARARVKVRVRVRVRDRVRVRVRFEVRVRVRDYG